MSEQKKDKDNQFITIGTIIISFLILAIIILVASTSSNSKKNQNGQQLSLDGNIRGQKVNVSGRFQDKKCGVSFSYPDYWEKSNIKLPLPQEPISQVTFDEPTKGDSNPKNSIFSFICYDAEEYSFEQFIKQNPFKQTGTLNVGKLEWKRSGNFVYAVKNNKLLIFQIFFTKNDTKPESGYEEIFMNIIKSVQ